MVGSPSLQRRCHLAVGEGVVGGREEITEEPARPERRCPNLHQPQPRRVREGAFAPQAHDLAARRCAAAGKPPAREADVRPETLDAGKRDEMTGDGALAEQDDRRRAGNADAGELRPDRPVNHPIGLVAPDRHPEPHRANGALGGGDALDRLSDAAVLRDLRSGENGDEHGRSDGDATRSE